MTQEIFFRYEALRQLGYTNMLNRPIVLELTGLTKEQYDDIIKNYSQYKAQYLQEDYNPLLTEIKVEIGLKYLLSHPT